MLGLGAFSELPFGDPNNAQIHNIEFAETGFGMTFTLGTEVATGGADIDVTSAGHQHSVLVMKQHLVSHSRT